MPVTPAPAVRPSLDRERLATLRVPALPRLAVEVLEEVTSTNAVVAERARAGAGEGLVVAAEHQTAARGRLGRPWGNPPRSALTFSVLLRPAARPERWPWIPLLVGYAAHRALRSLGHGTVLKWPNDLLVGDRKVAGILLERVESAAGPAAVVGIGLNTSLTPEELPVPTATSLAIEAGSDPDRTELLAALVTSLAEEYDAWRTGGEHGVRSLAARYAEVCVTLGRDVRVELPGRGPLTGRAVAIDDDGRLVVAGPDGPTAVGAGDVVHVRPVEPGVT